MGFFVLFRIDFRQKIKLGLLLFGITKHSLEAQCHANGGLIEMFQVENLSNCSKRGVCTRVSGLSLLLPLYHIAT